MSQELEKAKKIKDQSLDQIKQQIDQLQQLSQQLFTQERDIKKEEEGKKQASMKPPPPSPPAPPVPVPVVTIVNRKQNAHDTVSTAKNDHKEYLSLSSIQEAKKKLKPYDERKMQQRHAAETASDSPLHLLQRKFKNVRPTQEDSSYSDSETDNQFVD